MERRILTICNDKTIFENFQKNSWKMGWLQYNIQEKAADSGLHFRIQVKAIGISHRPKRKPNGVTKAERSARGSQYISALYRAKFRTCGIVQSMNSDDGRGHDNTRCESTWARMKEELLYGRKTPFSCVGVNPTIIYNLFKFC